MRAFKEEGRLRMSKLTACFICYLAQTMCGRTNPEARAEHDGLDEYHFGI